MAISSSAPDITTGRLEAHEYEKNFTDLHPLLNNYQARVEASRCYFVMTHHV